MFNKIKMLVITMPILLSACVANSVNNNLNNKVQAKPSVSNYPIKTVIKEQPIIHYAKFFTYQNVDIETEATADIGIMASLIEEDGCLLIARKEVPVFPHKTTKWNKNTQTFTWGRGNKATIGKMISYKPSDFVKNNTDKFKQYTANFVQKANPKCLENRDLIILE